MPEHENLVEIEKMTKRYPGVIALDNVDFTIRKGEAHVLVGENGAGKSTLVKILCGATVADECQSFVIDGRPAAIRTPKDAIGYGIAAIQQQFSLVGEMNVADNLFLGREFRDSVGKVDEKRTHEEARRALADMGVDIDPYAKVGRLSASNQQVIEICKALSQDPKLLIMDEPTSGLTRDEIRRLFEILARLRERGITMLYISHRLEEVFEVGQRVTVLRNGRNVLEANLSEIDHAGLTKAIVGQDLERRYPKEDAEIGAVALSVRGLSNDKTKPVLRDVSFDVRSGEILAIYGILGCGKDQLAETLFGRTPASAGSMTVGGKEVEVTSPEDAIGCGMGYLTEDRHRDGLVELASLMENLSLPSLSRKFSGFAQLKLEAERAAAEEFRQRLDLHAPNVDVLARNLSGGNQQKVVFGKWLLTDASILILNEPTKGIDIGSKAHIFQLMVEQAQKGAAVVLLTNELEEAVEMGDRVLVMLNGRVMKEVSRAEILSGDTTADEILRIATQRIGEDGQIAVSQTKQQNT
ncbi:MAG: sugar ABC transporter ATP-binding protein [Spirochaetaceae bacterium]|nr:MAG: sugar ABC transporter ATP-binding protein [Spirochaetaceae bacterium]